MKLKSKLFVFAAALSLTANAASSEKQRNIIFVNSEVTTHVVMPENLKLVDISTPNIIGNQCADNMVRMKPVVNDSIGDYSDGDFLGTITLIGEKHMAQYDVLYQEDPFRANSIYNVNYSEAKEYNNPEVKMPESEIAHLAWAAYGSKRKFNNINTSAYGLKGSVYNIYTVGDYIFIDFVLKNRTKIPYDIDEMRVKLSDKKETKATNYQTIELEPVFVLNDAKSFKKEYRQVIVLKKLTFPDDKILSIEVSETQISGRVLSMDIQYEDILNADGFDMEKITDKPQVKYIVAKDVRLIHANDRLAKENKSLKKDLSKAEKANKSKK